MQLSKPCEGTRNSAEGRPRGIAGLLAMCMGG
jgi:hypothetical protein